MIEIAIKQILQKYLDNLKLLIDLQQQNPTEVEDVAEKIEKLMQEQKSLQVRRTSLEEMAGYMLPNRTQVVNATVTTEDSNKRINFIERVTLNWVIFMVINKMH